MISFAPGCTESLHGTVMTLHSNHLQQALLQNNARLRDAAASMPALSFDVAPQRAAGAMRLIDIPSAVASLFGTRPTSKALSASASLNSLAGALAALSLPHCCCLFHQSMLRLPCIPQAST